MFRKRDFKINHLHSGGVITNYHCTSSCAHCLYFSGPNRQKDYIDQDTLIKNLEKIKSLGCHSIHIGGGEPFMNIEGLKMVIETAQSTGVQIEYVETNSSWYRDQDSAYEILLSLKEKGLTTLLISISPFHNERIPFQKVKGVIQACKSANIGIFPWVSEFFGEIDAFDDKRPHTLSEYEEAYGHDYLRRLPSRYWIHLGGRALKTFSRVFETKPCPEIISLNPGGCKELLDVSHFHLDLYGNYIPALCSGLAVFRDDLGKDITEEKYPILHTLFQRGIAGLYEMVSEEYDFQPKDRYLSKCHLCTEIRRFLVVLCGADFKDLQPKGFYESIS